MGANESPGASYTYSYDDAGNRTGVWLNGTRVVTQTFNAANQVNGYAYDAAGNLANDGTATYGYDALNRLTLRSTTPYTYNGDGALVQDTTTQYTQDLASPLQPHPSIRGCVSLTLHSTATQDAMWCAF